MPRSATGGTMTARPAETRVICRHAPFAWKESTRSKRERSGVARTASTAAPRNAAESGQFLLFHIGAKAAPAARATRKQNSITARLSEVLNQADRTRRNHETSRRKAADPDKNTSCAARRRDPVPTGGDVGRPDGDSGSSIRRSGSGRFFRRDIMVQTSARVR